MLNRVLAPVVLALLVGVATPAVAGADPTRNSGGFVLISAGGGTFFSVPREITWMDRHATSWLTDWELHPWDSFGAIGLHVRYDAHRYWTWEGDRYGTHQAYQLQVFRAATVSPYAEFHAVHHRFLRVSLSFSAVGFVYGWHRDGFAAAGGQVEAWLGAPYTSPSIWTPSIGFETAITIRRELVLSVHGQYAFWPWGHSQAHMRLAASIGWMVR